MDFITDLPASTKSGAKTILVITDRLSKGVILIPMLSISAPAVATAFMERYVPYHGFPRAIVSDRGTQFTSAVWAIICEALGIKRRLSSAYHPETDGATERANQVIQPYLRAYTTFSQDNWEDLLGIAQLAINNRVATSTGVSPFFMTHGYNIPPLDYDAAAGTEHRGARTPTEMGKEIAQKLREASDFAQAAIAYAQDIQQQYANQHRQPAERLMVGDRVWLNLKNVITDRPCKKLDWKNAKYTVLEVISSHSYRLDTPPGIHNVFHASLLKRATEDPFPSQRQEDFRPPAIMVDGEEEWEVERVLRKRVRGRQRQVLVKWKGYLNPTWEPAAALTNTEAYRVFEAGG